eukprot:evm.model.NODE_51321_length_12106_cov_17.260614.2
MGDALDDGFEAYDLELDAEEFADDDEPLIEAAPSKRKAEILEEGKVKKSKQQSKRQKQKGQDKGGEEEEEEGGEVEEEEEEEEEEDLQDEDNEGIAAANGEKKQKKKKKRKKKPKIPEPTAALTTAEAQSTYLWERYVNLLNISPLDADVNRFPPNCFILPSSTSSSASTALKRVKGKQPAKPTGHAQTPSSHPGKGDANVTDFLQQAFPQLQKIASDKSQREMAHPFVILVSSSAVRANELAKDLRMKLRNLKTAKLFAKHLKVDAQIEVLQTMTARKERKDVNEQLRLALF